MSRPCFALSVMLCCMAGPLLIIGKARAQAPQATPSHDPGECIVCPLAQCPLEICGGYSDYDYNKYWLDDYSPTASAAVASPAPEPEVAQSLTNGSTEQAWESGYEDYYADYVFGDDATVTDAEDLTLEEAPAPLALIDGDSETAPTLDAPQAEETSALYDDYGWSAEDSATAGDYFDSYDSYEPISPAKPDVVADDEATLKEAEIDYEAYEEEWFSPESETTTGAQEVTELKTDEAYEALSESESEAYSDEFTDAESTDAESVVSQPAKETWGDEEAWYREEFGDEGVLENEIAEATADLGPGERLRTGYDEAYDEAMVSEAKATEPVADSLPATPSAQSPEAADYESFYDAYDELYNFESTSTESFEAETSEVTVEPVLDEHVQQAMDSEPAWLTELVNRMLAPTWESADGTASNEPLLNRDSGSASCVDECAQEWDCESAHWARPQTEHPSVVLRAADTLDGIASLLNEAAELLRGVASGSLAETAQQAKAESLR